MPIQANGTVVTSVEFNDNSVSKVFYEGNLVFPTSQKAPTAFYILPMEAGELSFILKESTRTLSWTRPVLYYSTNNGGAYTELKKNTPVTLQTGVPVLIKQNSNIGFSYEQTISGITYRESYGLHFTGKYLIGGAISSLFNGSTNIQSYGLAAFFRGETTLLFNYCNLNCYGTKLYYRMFLNCSNLRNAPKFKYFNRSYMYCGMYRNCTNLISIPSISISSLSSSTDYLFDHTFYNCPSIKFSTSQSEERPNEYLIKVTSGTAQNNFSSMFSSFTPQINTTYYTNATVI